MFAHARVQCFAYQLFVCLCCFSAESRLCSILQWDHKGISRWVKATWNELLGCTVNLAQESVFCMSCKHCLTRGLLIMITGWVLAYYLKTPFYFYIKPMPLGLMTVCTSVMGANVQNIIPPTNQTGDVHRKTIWFLSHTTTLKFIIMKNKASVLHIFQGGCHWTPFKQVLLPTYSCL